ncbi:unnamed protein product [Ranitomeya imitator]|uniref:Uncharacterized protein n=1 Tax=Ranitomeya imitator TaxID=111125 RepID=A0ABN9KZT9_9NEOB|nr:unnamed protein product [Ranitomeya imitator]
MGGPEPDCDAHRTGLNWDRPWLDHDLKHAHELRQAAFKLYASLGANDEDIRKKVSLGEGRPPVLSASRQSVTST